MTVIFHESVHAYLDYLFLSQGQYDITNFVMSYGYLNLNEISNEIPRLSDSLRNALVVAYTHSSNTIQHEQMAQEYVQTIANAIAQFDGNKQSMTFYTQLAWGGLQGTKEWYTLSSISVDTIAIHNTIAHEEFGDAQAKGTKCPTIVQ